MMKDILISSFRFVGIIIVSYLLIRGFSDMAISALSTSATPLSMYTSTGLPMSAVPVQTKATPTSTISLSDIGNALSSGSPLSVAQLIYLSQQYPNALSTNQPFSLSDTASAVQSNLAALDQLYSNGVIGSISLTDSSAPQFSMSPSDFTNSSGLLSTINSAFPVQVNQPFSVAQALSLPPNLANKFLPLDIEDSAQNILSNNAQLTQSTSSIKYIVSDTAQNISNNFGSLSSLQSIQSFNILQDPNVSSQNQNLLTITDAQLNSNANLISKLPTNYLLNITNATAADATTLQKNPHVENIQISDTAKNISNNISNINSITKHMTVNVTDTAQNISLYSAQLNQLKAIYNTTITSSVSDIIAQSNNLNHLKSTFSINMSSSDLLNNLDSLEGLTKLNSINLTDNPSITNITLTADQYSKDKAVISKVAPPISVNLTNVPVSNLKTLAHDSNVQSISIVDNIGAMNSDAINTINSLSNLSSYTYFNSNRIQPISINSLTINVNNTTSNNNISQLATLKIPYNSTGSLPNFTINAQGILNYSSSGTISASAQSTLSAINQLNKGLDGNINLGQAIIQSGSNPPIPFTPTSPITSSQNTQIINLNPPLTGQYTVSMPQIGGGFVSRTVTLPPNSELQNLVNALSNAFANDNQDNVKFTSYNNSLQINYQNNGPTFWPKNINICDTASNLAKYANGSSSLSTNQNITYTVTDGIAAAQANNQSLFKLQSYSLSDTASNFSNNFQWLLDNNNNLSSINIIDQNHSINLTSDQIFTAATTNEMQVGSVKNNEIQTITLLNQLSDSNYTFTIPIIGGGTLSKTISLTPPQNGLSDLASSLNQAFSEDNPDNVTFTADTADKTDNNIIISYGNKGTVNGKASLIAESIQPNTNSLFNKISNNNFKISIVSSQSNPTTCDNAQYLETPSNLPANCQLQSISITDTTTNIQNLLQPTDGSSSPALTWNNLNNMSLSDSSLSNPSVISLNAASYLADQNILNKITSPYVLNITDATVAEITNPSNPSYILSNPKIKSVSVSDSSANVASNLQAISTIISQNKLKLSLSLLDSPISIAASQLELPQVQSALSSIKNIISSNSPNQFSINVNSMHISDIALIDKISNKLNINQQYSILDTATNISNYINSNPTNLNEISQLTATDAASPININNSVIFQGQPNSINTYIVNFLNNKFNGSNNINFIGTTSVSGSNPKTGPTITGPTITDLNSVLSQLNTSILSHISGYSISDTAQNISNLNTLVSPNLLNKVKSISILDPSNPIDLSSINNSNFQNMIGILKSVASQFTIKFPANATMITSLINSGLNSNLKSITLTGAPSNNPPGNQTYIQYTKAYNSLVSLLGQLNVSIVK